MALFRNRTYTIQRIVKLAVRQLSSPETWKRPSREKSRKLRCGTEEKRGAKEGSKHASIAVRRLPTFGYVAYEHVL